MTDELYKGKLAILRWIGCIVFSIALFVGCKCGKECDDLVTSAERDSFSSHASSLRHSSQKERENSHFDIALQYSDSALQWALKSGDTIEIVSCYNEIGTIFRRIGRIEDAVRYHYTALRYAEQYHDTLSNLGRKGISVSLNGIGNAHLSINDYNKAEAAFRRALKGETELNSIRGQAINWANLGSIQERQGNLDSAYVCYERSMQCNKRINSVLGQSLCYNYFGYLCELKKDYKGALYNYLKSYELIHDSEDRWHAIEATINLSHIYILTNQLAVARPYLDDALATAREMHSLEHLQKTYTQFSLYEERRGDAKAALEYFRKSVDYTDSINSAQSAQNIRDVVISYETQKVKQDAEASRLAYLTEQRLRHTISWFMIGAFVLFVAVVAAMVVAQQSRKRALDALRQLHVVRNAFFKNVTHEFRTPLTTILGMSDQMRKELAVQGIEPKNDGINWDYCLKSIHVQGERLLELVNRLLDETRKEAAYNEVISLSPEGGKSVPVPSEEIVTDSIALAGGDAPTVLVVEDNSEIRYYIQHLLNARYEVITACDGRDALRKMEIQQPDLIVTDLMMPDMDGYELCHAVRQSTLFSDIPLIMVTARIEDQDRMRGYKEGADAYLTKPFNPEELCLRIEKLLEQRRVLRDHLMQELMSEMQQKDKDEENRLMESDPAVAAALQISASDKEFLCRLTRYVESNLYQGNISVDMVAREMGLSATPLNAKVRNLTGLSVATYVLSIRLARSRQMIETTNTPVGEIAMECGFSSLSYFSHAFKRYYGVIPSALRTS